MSSCHCVATHVPAVHRFHGHHVIPRSWGGPDVAWNIEHLCPSGHYNAHSLLNHYVRAQNVPSWEIRRTFSAFTRRLGERAWEDWIARNPVNRKPPWTGLVTDESIRLRPSRLWLPPVGMDDCDLAA